MDEQGGAIYALATPMMTSSGKRSLKRRDSWKAHRRQSGETVFKLEATAPPLELTKQDVDEQTTSRSKLEASAENGVSGAWSSPQLCVSPRTTVAL